MEKPPTQSDWLAIRPNSISLELSTSPATGRIVALGDRVTAGERVGWTNDASCIVSADGAVTDRDRAVGVLSIDVDPAYALPPEPPHHDHHDRTAIAAKLEGLRHADRGVWLERLRAAGIAANRVGCPDLSEQFRQALTRPIDTVVCCGLDTESSLPFASLLATRFATELVVGVALMAKILGAPTAITAIDAASPVRATAAARHWSARTGVKLNRLVNRYPQADPTLLLYTLLRRRLLPGQMPTTTGVLLLDAPAAIAIGQAFVTDAPVTNAFTVVRDVGSRQARRARVPIGTDLTTVLRSTGMPFSGITLRAGQLLHDVRVDPRTTRIGKGELTYHVAPPEPTIIPDPCVRCGWCVEICPTRVHPAGLLDAAQRDDREMAERHGLHACIECGLCTYVCPSKLPLLGTIRQLRSV